MDEVLLEWVYQRRSSGLRVSRKVIFHNARAIHEQKCKLAQVPPSFIASNGYVQKFMAWNGRARRQRMRSKSFYSHSEIIAMDETAVWQEMLSSTTVDNVGEKSIRLRTTGHEKSSLGMPESKGRRDKAKTLYCLSGWQARNKTTKWRVQLQVPCGVFCQRMDERGPHSVYSGCKGFWESSPSIVGCWLGTHLNVILPTIQRRNFCASISTQL